MELKVGRTYAAFLPENPIRSFKFRVERVDDLFAVGKVVDAPEGVELLRPYLVRTASPAGEFLKVAPYEFDPQKETLKLVLLGRLSERRRFVRYPLLHLGIEAESEYFTGFVENASLGGLKVRVKEWKKTGLPLKEGESFYARLKVKGKDAERVFHLVLKTLAAGPDFVSAAFERPAAEASEFFYSALRLLGNEGAPEVERRRFRRFFTLPLGVLVDTPLGSGVMVDLSLGGAKVELKTPKEGPPPPPPFTVEFRLPEGERFFVDARVVGQTPPAFLSLAFEGPEREVLRLVSRVLDRLSEL
ncbi:MAG: PilZ domain-containing protein [Aquificae bacterium]|nr:PilZ domain-containing protein [Aquificota bacterium]